MPGRDAAAKNKTLLPLILVLAILFLVAVVVILLFALKK